MILIKLPAANSECIMMGVSINRNTGDPLVIKKGPLACAIKPCFPEHGVKLIRNVTGNEIAGVGQ